MAIVRTIESLKEFDAVLKSNELVFVDFYATWCGPCRNIAPLYKELSQKYSKNRGVAFIKVDVDMNEDIGQKYKIHAMPTFMVFKGGEKVQEWSSGRSSELKYNVVQKLQEHLGPSFKPDPEDVEGTDLDTRGSFWPAFFLILLLGSMLLQYSLR